MYNNIKVCVYKCIHKNNNLPGAEPKIMIEHRADHDDQDKHDQQDHQDDNLDRDDQSNHDDPDHQETMRIPDMDDQMQATMLVLCNELGSWGTWLYGPAVNHRV